MNTISITARKDFLRQISAAPALRALSELIWNGFDAGATRVQVTLDTNALGGLEEVRVLDNGSGICREQVHRLFGDLGQSWKRGHPKLHGRILHGRNGRGRFKGFAIGGQVEWRSCFSSDDGPMSYRISGAADSLESLHFTDPEPSQDSETGTEVVISDIRGTFGSLLSESAPYELARIFGIYLSQYPKLELIYQGTTIDPASVLEGQEQDFLAGLPLPGGTEAAVSVLIHEWSMPSKRGIHLCDENGQLLHEVEVGPAVRAPGYAFTVKACSDAFRRLEDEQRLTLGELDPDVAALVAPVRERVKAHFRQRKSAQHGKRIEAWLDEGSHPFPDLPSEAPQRRAFDCVASHLSDAGSGLEKLEPLERMLYFQVLGNQLIDQPEKLLDTINELFPMKAVEAKTLKDLLC